MFQRGEDNASNVENNDQSLANQFSLGDPLAYIFMKTLTLFASPMTSPQKKIFPLVSPIHPSI